MLWVGATLLEDEVTRNPIEVAGHFPEDKKIDVRIVIADLE